MSMMVSQITSLTIVYSTIYSGADERKHQSSASLAFVRGIHRWPVNSPHKGPVTWKMFPFDDVIMVFFEADVLRVMKDMHPCQTTPVPSHSMFSVYLIELGFNKYVWKSNQLVFVWLIGYCKIYQEALLHANAVLYWMILICSGSFIWSTLVDHF